MSYRTGIIAAQDGKTIRDEPQAYRSDYGHLLVDSRPEVGHLRIYEGRCGPQLTASQSAVENIFMSFKHNLPFIPRVSVYMLIRDGLPDQAPLIGKYAGGIIIREAFPISEQIRFGVNGTDVYLKHNFAVADTQTFTSQLDQLLIRAKIIVNVNDVAGEPYESQIPFLQ